MLSVAICTYNGARFIREQIASILGQTVPVDEIVVCDDCSTDDTLEIVESMKTKANVLFRVFRNEENVGFKENFFNAIERCNGDLVFLADQDDVWHPDKVETIVNWFEGHPDKQVVFTDASLIDDRGIAIEGSLWERFGFDSKKQRFFNHGCALDIWMWSNRATGATMAVRKSFVEKGWRAFSDKYHDEVIALQGIASHAMGYISQRLMDYRLHDDQVCGAAETPLELQYTPLKPCPELSLGSCFDALPVKERQHVEFVLKRAMPKKTRFGWDPITNLCSYVRIYRAWAFMFFIYDLGVFVKHSFRKRS